MNLKISSCKHPTLNRKHFCFKDRYKIQTSIYSVVGYLLFLHIRYNIQLNLTSSRLLFTFLEKHSLNENF